jgi:hypothetical protein
VPTTLLSVGSRVEPQVDTSAAVEPEAALTRLRTYLNFDAEVHVPDAEGKFTLR